MNRDALPYRIATTLLRPFQYLPNGPLKAQLRERLWALAGSGIFLRPLHLPRDDLLIDSGDTVVLVGCQRVEKIEAVLELIGPSGDLFIVEANSDAVDSLSNHQDADTVEIIHAAVWTDEFEAEIGVKEAMYPAVRVLEGEQYTEKDYDKTQEVQAAPLHKLLPKNTSPDYIEIAVNGTEPSVLQGCLQTLQQSGSRVYLKNYGVGGNDEPDRTPALMSRLQTIDYNAVFSPTRPWFGRIEPHDPDADILAQPQTDAGFFSF